ncbi:hypothetical protein MiTe_01832 [Microcystis aeruginosa NIES-2520]|uniref:Uncharacterized protein n=2 Tax=Microcystis aeruginosa TaxID=1126 RepID=A0A5A5REP6_MICAE|nr:hypothetical protein MiTe_01832 [Microcystis aeruginosa NIES-2520]
MYQMNKTAIDQWLKGVGIFLLIFIDVDYLLTTRFGSLKGNEKYEAVWYLFILISIIFLPTILGKVLNYLSSILSKIINNWQVTNQSRNLEFLISWGLGLVFNTIAIQKLFTQGTAESLRLYMKPEMSYQLASTDNLFIKLEFFGANSSRINFNSYFIFSLTSIFPS